MSHTVTAGRTGGESPTLMLATLAGVTLPAFDARQQSESDRPAATSPRNRLAVALRTPVASIRRAAGWAVYASPLGRRIEDAYLAGYRAGRRDARGGHTDPDGAALLLRRLASEATQ